MNKKTKKVLLEFVIMLIIYSFNDKTLIIGFLWIILHEITHIIIAKHYGASLSDFEVNLTGAKIKLKNIEELDRSKKCIIYFSGPLFNLFMYIIFLILTKFNIISFCESMGINLGLFIFNMFPAYPLDGARIYEILLSKKFSCKKSKTILINISYVFSALLIFIFLLITFIHKVNISLLVTSILITYSTWIEKSNAVDNRVLEEFLKQGKK
ncbi:MAG: site-2 protease family protein [Clostridium sp.]|nr:peptidase M50 [Clostridium sp.]